MTKKTTTLPGGIQLTDTDRGWSDFEKAFKDDKLMARYPTADGTLKHIAHREADRWQEIYRDLVNELFSNVDLSPEEIVARAEATTDLMMVAIQDRQARADTIAKLDTQKQLTGHSAEAVVFDDTFTDQTSLQSALDELSSKLGE